MLFLLISTIFVFRLDKINPSTLNRSCLTKGCNETAQKIIAYMNPKVDPCKDFYEFACGGFISQTKIPRGKEIVSLVSLLEDSLDDKLDKILTNNNSQNQLKIFNLTKLFYKDCLQAENKIFDWYDSVMEKVKKLGGWPVITPNWNEKTFSLIDTIINAREMGFTADFLWNIDITPNPQNTSYNVIAVMPPTPCFLMFFQMDKKKAVDYFKLMVQVASKYSHSPEIVTELQKSNILEANILVMVVQFFQLPIFKTTTIADMQKYFPYVNWMETIAAYIGPKTEVISKSTEILLVAPFYFFHLRTMLKKTSQRTLANYCMWQIIWYGLYFDMPDPSSSRKKHCLLASQRSWNFLIPVMYVREFFNKQMKDDVYKTAKQIKKEIRESISNSKWLNKITRQKALEKIDSLLLQVGYPEIFMDDKEIDRYYQDVPVINNNYYEWYLALNKFQRKAYPVLLKQRNSRSDWRVNPLLINAQYDVLSNAIYIPAGFLSKSVYREDVPHYINFASIGFVIGHEISHGFDSLGSLFDKNGYRKDWWTSHDKRTFAEKMQCLIKQYNSYKINGTEYHVNGKLTVKENTADNEGIRNAYRAYIKSTNKSKVQFQLPGLRYNTKQIFWITAAQLWCSCLDTKVLKLMLKNEHPPHKFRVIGPFSNQIDFAKDFQCPVNSYMNPKTKCTLW